MVRLLLSALMKECHHWCWNDMLHGNVILHMAISESEFNTFGCIWYSRKSCPSIARLFLVQPGIWLSIIIVRFLFHLDGPQSFSLFVDAVTVLQSSFSSVSNTQLQCILGRFLDFGQLDLTLFCIPGSTNPPFFPTPFLAFSGA
jgi:hypothetical protein